MDGINPSGPVEMNMENTHDWVVLKFGGTSVKSLADWRVISKRVDAVRASGKRAFIVHSAIAGTSDALEDLIEASLVGQGEPVLESIQTRQLELAHELGLSGEDILAVPFDELTRLSAGLALTGDASPRLKARIMAQGELMATAIGAAWLNASGIDALWLDAREALTARPGQGVNAWLGVDCDYARDPALLDRIADQGVVITQGFIARRSDGDTAVLGRGGSDTSAAYFASKLDAGRLEIWTDVPGFFSADPRLTAAARQIKALSYAEAQELASMGAGVLHPRAIAPIRASGISLQVLCTHQPDMAGTRISATPSEDTPRLKAVSVKHGVRLITLETDGMWQASGFLARAFAPFAQHGVSIDLVSTSETSVTVSLDEDPSLTPDVLAALETDLAAIARVEMIADCAAVSLVGRGVRALLAQLGPAMEAFAHYPVRLVSQAANDLNLTVVVDGDQGKALCRKLHDQLIQPRPLDETFGPSWAEISQAGTDLEPVVTPHIWWREKRADLLALSPANAPLYVYDRETVHARASAIAGLKNLDRGWYAMKANGHPDLLRTAVDAGLGLECVSIHEVRAALAVVPGLTGADILFTPNFAPRAEYAEALELGTHLTLDGLHPLKSWPDLFAGRDITLRVNPQRPEGHHKHVRTAGPEAKFGLHADELPIAMMLAEKAGAKIIGLHVHSGSGISDPEHWRRVGVFLAAFADTLPDVRILDLGGGLGVDEASGPRRVDLDALDDMLGDLKIAHPDYELWLEPGRFVVAEAGVLLARVTQIKQTPDARFVGINAGMNSLLRPALYGSRHDIVNLTRIDEPSDWITDIVGPICESSDKLGTERLLPVTHEDDVMLIANGGAYGRVMASSYNMREPAGEIVI
jgi:diaminopimelate decarboxylase/aspartate kinase